MSCEQGIRQSRIDRSLTGHPLQNSTENSTAPEEIDLVPELHPSVGYEKIVTAIDVFSICFFTYSTKNQDAKTIAKVTFNIMTKYAYLPTTLISDESTVFLSRVIEEVAGVIGIILKHTTTKHAKQLACWNNLTRQSNNH